MKIVKKLNKPVLKTKPKKVNPKKSEAARAVAREVIATVRKGRIPNKQKIQEKYGYSKESSRTGKATQTKTYRDEMKTVIQAMELERERAIKAMKTKIKGAKYRDVIDAADKLTKNIELLSGRDTARVGGLVDDIFDKL